MLEFARKLERLERIYRALPNVAGNMAVTFFKERFRAQNWVDDRTETWPKRKENKRQRENNKGRAVLVKTGRLKRSIRITRKGKDFVAIGSDVPYAKAHNEGAKIRGTAKVKSHKRKYGFYDEEVSAPGARKEKFERKHTGVSQVTAHDRQMNTNLPKRQFMGPSKILKRKILRQVQSEILKALR